MNKPKKDLLEEILELETILKFYQGYYNSIKSMDSDQKNEHILDIMIEILERKKQLESYE